MQVLVGGHSFVRRFRDDLTKRQMTLDTDNVSVTMIAQGGAYCAGPRSLMPKINDCYTDKYFPATSSSILYLYKILISNIF